MKENEQTPSTETPDETSDGIPEAVKELNEHGGFIYRALTKLVAWAVFGGGLTLLVGTLVFIALALWHGIQWLWPWGEHAIKVNE